MRLFTSLLLAAVTSAPLLAGDWPQYLGNKRDSAAVDEKAVTGSPEPEILWQRKLGSGHAGAVVVKDKVIVFHRQNDELITEALAAADGSPLWRHSAPTHYTDDFGFDDGPRATPCVAEGKVIVHGPEGLVQALDLATGSLVWSYDTVAQLQSPKGFFGRACSPLVAEGKVLLNVGGRNTKGGAGIIALDLQTGKLLWQASDDEASYASPILLPDDPGTAVFFTRSGVVMVQVSDGKVLATEPFRARENASVNAATPVDCGKGRLLFSAAYDVGAALWRWNKNSRTLEPLWKKADTLDCHYMTPVFYEGHVFGLHGRQEQGTVLRCVEVETGKVRWEAPDSVRGGTLVRVGSRLLLFTEAGELWVFSASGEKFDLLSRSQITRAGHRSHAAFANGVLFARDAEKLVAVKVQ